MSGSIVNIGWTSGCSYLTLENVGDHLYKIILEENPDVEREKLFGSPVLGVATPKRQEFKYKCTTLCTMCSNTLLTFWRTFATLVEERFS